MSSFERDSIHHPPGATNVAPSGVLRGLSAASCSRTGAALASGDGFAAAPMAARAQAERRNKDRGMTHRVRIPTNVTIRENRGKPFLPTGLFPFDHWKNRRGTHPG